MVETGGYCSGFDNCSKESHGKNTFSLFIGWISWMGNASCLEVHYVSERALDSGHCRLDILFEHDGNLFDSSKLIL